MQPSKNYHELALDDVSRICDRIVETCTPNLSS
jgi:hypothetical protein